eukprot:TRINITY_DN15360_c0_g1_i1.p1 TRINITY_DN15360_c0_g1~~TRINITY_DN15360_c0_g1_i1.p1  ORF type:complete len:386 (-),score=44.24 TRINITY_DN15360_c0_g1_i1:205-1362(-)
MATHEERQQGPVVLWLHAEGCIQFGLNPGELSADLGKAGVELLYVTGSQSARAAIAAHPQRVRAVVQNMKRSRETSGLDFIDNHHKQCEDLRVHIPVATLSQSLTADPALLVGELRERLETDMRCNPMTIAGRRQLIGWILDQCFSIVVQAVFVRHGEALHNQTSNWKLPDPELTDRGKQQSEWLGRQDLLGLISHDAGLKLSFAQAWRGDSDSNGYAVGFQTNVSVVSSPLKRPLQTCHHAGLGRARCILLEPDLQEAGEAPCDRGSDRDSLLTWIRDQAIDASASSLPAGWEHKTGINSAARLPTRMAQFAINASGGRYGQKFIAVSHDKALQQLLRLDRSAGPSWNERAWVPFENCEARGYWMLGDRRWFPIPGINFRPPAH